MNERALWSVFWIAVAASIASVCFSSKACNDADDAVWSGAVAKGCTVLHCGDGAKIFCGGTGPVFCR